MNVGGLLSERLSTLYFVNAMRAKDFGGICCRFCLIPASCYLNECIFLFDGTEVVFGDTSSHDKIAFSSIDGMTDEAGTADVFPSSDRLTPGFWEAAGHVTVTSTGGASVSDRFTLRKLSSSRLVGVRIAKGSKPFANQPFSIELVAAGPLTNEVPVGNVEVLLEKLETDWVLQRVDGRWIWHRRDDAFEVARELVENVAGAGKDFSRIRMTCPEPGIWRVVARDLVGGGVTSVRLDVSREGETLPAVGSPHRVALSLDRPSYRPGEVARLAVETPFPGQLLLTVETDRVAWAKTFSISDTKAVLKVPLPKPMPGGAFVTASVVRPLDFDSPDWKIPRPPKNYLWAVPLLRLSCRAHRLFFLLEW